ncbi:type VII secretion target [Streptomyces sp. NPDC059897]|uniref:type VII secretion target n=1 Tax=Streptomyces sp. NPDC059897 TaxID=3346994 RepID=UPI0036541A7D
MADIDINAARVRTAADDTASLARSTAQRLGHSLDASDDVHASHHGHGWQSPERLRDCARAWEEHLVSLAKRMGELSEKLRDSADGYDRADAEAESRLRAGLQGLAATPNDSGRA